MSRHYPKIRLRVGDTVIFDGYGVTIEKRAGPDTFRTTDSGGREERHMDWFVDQAEQAESVVIER